MPISPSSSLPDKRSPQFKACFEWLDAISVADFDRLSAIVTDDYVQDLRPVNKNYPALDTREAFLAFYKMLLPNFASFEMTINKVEESAEAVTIECCSDAHTTGGYPYHNEYTITFTVGVQADGSYKVGHVIEFFTNPAYTAGLQSELGI